jgi:hypothetical protein
MEATTLLALASLAEPAAGLREEPVDTDEPAALWSTLDEEELQGLLDILGPLPELID